MTTRTDDLRSGVKQALLHNLIRIPLLLYVMTIIVPFVFMLINSFKSREELETLLSEDLLLNDTSAEVNTLSVMDALQRYMTRASVDPNLAERAVKVFENLVKSSKPKSKS